MESLADMDGMSICYADVQRDLLIERLFEQAKTTFSARALGIHSRLEIRLKFGAGTAK